MIDLVIPGKARGKGRPRFNTKTGRTYTDAKTRSAEELIRAVWLEAGRPSLEDAPFALELELVLARPKAHFLKDGSLSTAGLRSEHPVRKPDLDNALKLLDALNGLAFTDDAQLVTALVWKRWASADESEHMRLTLRAIGTGFLLRERLEAA